jgi:radical SAM protein with 4Fe4S-binding SPASM domain
MRISSGVCTPRCLLDIDCYQHIRFGSCNPDLDKRPITLDLEGNLRYCNHSPVHFANIFRARSEDIAASSYLAQWRDERPEPCMECALWERCHAGCRAASEQLGLGLNCVDPALTLADIEVKARRHSAT